MDVQDTINFIGTVSREQCDEIINAAGQRKRTLQETESQRQIHDHWRTLIFLRKGDTVYCGAQGRFIGGCLQPGDRAKVLDIELGRRKVLWLDVRERGRSRVIGFRPNDAFVYGIQRNKPTASINNKVRKQAEAIEQTLREVMATANAAYGNNGNRSHGK